MTECRLPIPALSLVVFATLLAAAAPALGAPQLYVRASVGLEESGDVTVEDLDCASTAPPALFGCVDGPDGRPIEARGDLGDSAAFEIAGGVELGRRTRLKLALASRPATVRVAHRGPAPVRHGSGGTSGAPLPLAATVRLVLRGTRRREVAGVAG